MDKYVERLQKAANQLVLDFTKSHNQTMNKKVLVNKDDELHSFSVTKEVVTLQLNYDEYVITIKRTSGEW